MVNSSVPADNVLKINIESRKLSVCKYLLVNKITHFNKYINNVIQVKYIHI